MKSVKTKLFIMITVISLIPLMITNFYFYKNLSFTLRNNTISSLSESLSNLSKRTTIYMQTIETYPYLITEEELLLSSLKTQLESDTPDYSLIYQNFRDATKTFFLRINFKNSLLTNASSCYLYIPKDGIFMDSTLTFYEKIPPQAVPFYHTLSKDGFENCWLLTHSLDFHALFHQDLTYSKNAISYVMPLYLDNSPAAAISINLQHTYFTEAFQSLSNITGGNLLVFKDDKLLTSSEAVSKNLQNYIFNETITNEKILENNFTLSYEGNNYLTVSHHLEPYHLRFVYIIPDNIYLGNISQIMPNVILLCFLLLLLLILLCMYISHMFYAPIRPLLAVMENVQNNNLETRITVQRSDEYQRIYIGFNNMMEEVNSLIDRLLLSTSLQKDSQIKLLQAQMNPHFIYNTLESIYSLAKIHGEEEIAVIIESLSSFYRFSLSGGASEITLQQAISMTEDYLTIQNFRFDHPITYTIDIPPKLKHVMIPKFAIQAIVENSICHGMEPLNNQGHLTISAYEEEAIFITITDNGIGISPQILLELQHSISTPFESKLQQQETENFALRSLNQQIKLHYGENYGLTLESKITKGTKVIIKLPFTI